MIDAASRAILETVGAAGFTIQLEANSVTAIDQKSNEQFIVNLDGDKFWTVMISMTLSSSLLYKSASTLRMDRR